MGPSALTPTEPQHHLQPQPTPSEDAGISLQEIHRTRTGVFAAAYSPFLPAALAPDETYLR